MLKENYRIKEKLDWATSLGGKASTTLTRFIRYITSSSGTLILDFLILGFLTEIIDIFYLLSVVFSFVTSNSVNYFINRRWSFRDTTTRVVKGYFYFLFFGIVGLVITVFLMWFFVEIADFQYLFARVIVAVIEGTIGFILNSIFTFKIQIMGLNNFYFSRRRFSY